MLKIYLMSLRSEILLHGNELIDMGILYIR